MAVLKDNGIYTRRGEKLTQKQWQCYFYGQSLRDYKKELDTVLTLLLHLCVDDSMTNEFIEIANKLSDYQTKASNVYAQKKRECGLNDF